MLIHDDFPENSPRRDLRIELISKLSIGRPDSVLHTFIGTNLWIIAAPIAFTESIYAFDIPVGHV
jgi:hypothetical protein